MKRFLVTLFALMVALPVLVLAQGEPGLYKMSLGATFEVSIPVGDFQTVAGTGYGGNLRYQYGSDSRMAFTATAGYLVWGKKDLGQNTSVQPKAFNIFLGGKYYLAKNFYGSFEGGLYFLSYTYEGYVVGAKGNTTWFMLPLGIGYQQSGFEVGVRYMIWATDLNNFSLTVGYNFAL
jgi:hypothetical protein